MKHGRTRHIWLLLVLAALIALPAWATEEGPARDAGIEPASVAVHISESAPAHVPHEPVHVDPNDEETALASVDEGAEAPDEGIQEGDQTAGEAQLADGEAESASAEDAQAAPEDEHPDAALPVEPTEPAPVGEEPTPVLPDGEQTGVASEAPWVEVEFAFEGDVLAEGAVVTMTAHVHNIPEGTALTFQWQNDATGRFEDVDGATERTFVFRADTATSGCQWRVRVEGRSA